MKNSYSERQRNLSFTTDKERKARKVLKLWSDFRNYSGAAFSSGLFSGREGRPLAESFPEFK